MGFCSLRLRLVPCFGPERPMLRRRRSASEEVSLLAAGTSLAAVSCPERRVLLAPGWLVVLWPRRVAAPPSVRAVPSVRRPKMAPVSARWVASGRCLRGGGGQPSDRSWPRPRPAGGPVCRPSEEDWVAGPAGMERGVSSTPRGVGRVLPCSRPPEGGRGLACRITIPCSHLGAPSSDRSLGSGWAAVGLSGGRSSSGAFRCSVVGAEPKLCACLGARPEALASFFARRSGCFGTRRLPFRRAEALCAGIWCGCGRRPSWPKPRRSPRSLAPASKLVGARVLLLCSAPKRFAKRQMRSPA